MPYEVLDSGRYEVLDTPSAPAPTRLEKVGMGMADPINGGAQLLTHILPQGVVDAGNSLNNWLADKTGLVARLPAGGVDEQVRQREADYQARRASAGEFGIDGYRMLGEAATTLPLAFTAPAATLPARMALGAATGAGTSALAPVTQGNYADEKAKQIAGGALVGGALPAVASGVARVISPKASLNPDVQLLRNEGVTPTIGQALGGRFNAAEEKLTSVPIVGDAISNARGRALEQFNSAAINRATAPVGVRVQGVGQDAVKDAGDAISNVYNQCESMLGGFQIDQQAQSQLANLRQLAQTGLEGKERRAVDSYFSDYLSKPALTADAFKELDSKLATDVGRYSGSPDAYQQKVGDVLATARQIISDNAKRANPQAAQVLKKADAAWANLVRVEGAAKAGVNQGGLFTPGQLNAAVRAADTSMRDRATARGTALMQDLSGAGQAVLGNKVPNSFTTDRALLAGGGLGAYLVNPSIPIGLLGGAALYSKPAQGLLSGAVTARPQSAQAVADALRKAAPGLGLLGGPIGAQLLPN